EIADFACLDGHESVSPEKRSLGGERVSNALEPAAERAVYDQIPGAQYGAADECRVRGVLQAYRAPEPPLEGRGELASLGLIERRSGGHGHIDHPFGLALELIEQLRD